VGSEGEKVGRRGRGVKEKEEDNGPGDDEGKEDARLKKFQLALETFRTWLEEPAEEDEHRLAWGQKGG